MVLPTSISDGVVTLRLLRADDAPSMFQAVCESLDDLKPWMAWAHDAYTQKESQDWITLAQARWNEGGYYGFAILEPGTQTFLGTCSLSHLHPVYHFCNLGYWIRTGRRGRGYAGRAGLLAARFAFERLGLVRVEIVVSTGNTASRRVADKIKAHYEGILLNRMVVGTQIHDGLMYSLVPSDFGLAARL